MQYHNAKTTIKRMEQTEPIKIKCGVIQWDTLSPKLCNQAIENIFKKVEWEKVGITIDGKYMNHLRYAEDILLITDKEAELQRMIEELDTESTKIGLMMNYYKSKIMSNQYEEVITTVAQTKIEHVTKYKYLGQIINLNK